jgi:hypothetical protein
LQDFSEKKSPVHEALLRGDPQEIGTLLGNPMQTALLFGFDSPYLGETQTEGIRLFTRQWDFDNLLRLAEAIGVRRLFNPEAGLSGDIPDTETILSDLDEVFGCRIEFPNPFPGETGLSTSRGVASWRAIQALYQAFRIRQLCGDRSTCRVLEIGAGLGRTAYYARQQLGIRNYTVVDLPITGVAQAYFLGCALGSGSIELYGETSEAGIRILPPQAFFDSEESFDLVVNVDSLTEMSPDTARRYVEAIAKRASIFLSINHEVNAFTVRNLYRTVECRHVSRNPYWMRRGYVEEVVRFPVGAGS